MIYLASPYSHPDRTVEAIRFGEVCRIAGVLMSGPILRGCGRSTCSSRLPGTTSIFARCKRTLPSG